MELNEAIRVLTERANSDPGFMKRLLEETKTAIQEATGIIVPDEFQLPTLAGLSDEELDQVSGGVRGMGAVPLTAGNTHTGMAIAGITQSGMGIAQALMGVGTAAAAPAPARSAIPAGEPDYQQIHDFLNSIREFQEGQNRAGSNSVTI